MEEKKSKKIMIVIIAICIICLIGVGIVFFWYNSNLKSVAKAENASIIKISIEEGMGISSISKLLEENNVIKSATVMKIYSKLNGIDSLQAGNYEFDNTENLPTILEHIANGHVVNNEIKITFIEGKNMRGIAKTIAKHTNHTEQEVFHLLEDETYIDSLIEKYWFLTEEIKNEDIYYPLEGYLLPDTYVFEDKDVSIETIFAVMLNYMDKFLTENKENILHNLTVHQMLTMASMAELEGKSTEDRQEIIGVFFNRINKKMNLGSDVTTYYAFKVDMGERDLTVKELQKTHIIQEDRIWQEKYQ